MKLALYLWLTMFYFISNAQNSKPNYIEYYNYSNEAIYHFYELNFHESVDLFEKSFDKVSIVKPDHHYNYCRALWEIGEYKKAIKELKKSSFHSYLMTDSTYFTTLDNNTKYRLSSSNKKFNQTSTEKEHTKFIDSLFKSDQTLRLIIRDSIEVYHNDSVLNCYNKLLMKQDEQNGISLLKYAKKHGFPGGINSNWNPKISIVLLHLGKEFYIENYSFLIDELKKGNLEPWMLSRCIDRFFVNDSQTCTERVTTYNNYFKDNTIDPFLMFMNRKNIGLSPYYQNHWRLYTKGNKPKRTKQYGVYRTNKSVYNTTL